MRVEMNLGRFSMIGTFANTRKTWEKVHQTRCDRYVGLACTTNVYEHLTQLQGTWQFLSALLLKYPTKPYELADDLESFIHILCWFALRFHRHNYTIPDALSGHIYTMYDVCGIGNDGHRGGDAKYAAVIEGTLGFLLDTDECSPGFVSLLRQLRNLCKVHYEYVQVSNPPYMTKSSKRHVKTPFKPRKRMSPPEPHDPYLLASSLVTTQLESSPLDDHGAMESTFRRFLSLQHLWIEDKIEDQFAQIPVMGTIRKRKSASGSDTSDG